MAHPQVASLPLFPSLQDRLWHCRTLCFLACTCSNHDTECLKNLHHPTLSLCYLQPRHVVSVFVPQSLQVHSKIFAGAIRYDEANLVLLPTLLGRWRSVACLGPSLGAMPRSGPGMSMALAPGMPCAPAVACAEPSKPELGGTGPSPAPPAGPPDSPPVEQGNAECCTRH